MHIMPVSCKTLQVKTQAYGYRGFKPQTAFETKHCRLPLNPYFGGHPKNFVRGHEGAIWLKAQIWWTTQTYGIYKGHGRV